MAQNDADLDGFPVLRIDQIPQIPTHVLERANVEVVDLIEQLKQDGGKTQNSLVNYLYRQMGEVDKEVAKRAAQDRVMALLSGAESAMRLTEHPPPRRVNRVEPKQDFFDKSVTPSPLKAEKRVSSASTADMVAADQAQMTPEKRVSTSQSDHTPDRHKEPLEVPKKMRIPLPSELRRRESSALATAALDPSTQTIFTGDLGSTEESSSVISSRSVGGNEAAISPGGRSDMSVDGEAKPRRRPRSGQPSRRSMAALEQNFGNEFVVGATERKRRFYPKKVVQETEEQIRARARESRYT